MDLLVTDKKNTQKTRAMTSHKFYYFSVGKCFETEFQTFVSSIAKNCSTSLQYKSVGFGMTFYNL